MTKSPKETLNNQQMRHKLSLSQAASEGKITLKGNNNNDNNNNNNNKQKTILLMPRRRSPL